MFNMENTEILTQEEVQSAEQNAEQFYDSYESIEGDESVAAEDTQVNVTQNEVQATSTEDQLLTAADKNTASVKTKAKYATQSPKVVRRSQRNKKRRRVDHVSRTLQADYSEDFGYIEGLSEIEQSFNARMTKLEQTFTNMMATQTQQNATLLQNFLKDFEDKITGKVTKLIDDKIDAKTAQLSQQIEKITAELAANKADIQQASQRADDKAKETVAEITAKIDRMSASGDAPAEAMTDIQQRIKAATEQMSSLTTKFDSQERKIEQLEYHSRKLNLVFDGVHLRDRESCKSVIETIIHRNLRLDMRGAIDVAHTLGDRAEGRQLPIIVRFRTVADKQRVLENSHELRRDGIYVRPDYPTTVNTRRNYLAKSLAAAKAIDPQARLFRDRLRFKGKLFSVDNIHEANIGDKNHTVVTPSQVRFYGYNSPFSNFHKSEFTLHDVRYNCVEQALQGNRAYRNRDDATWHQIMAENNPVNMKRLGKRHRPRTPEEESVDRQLMEDAVYAKFNQNQSLKEKLLATQERAFFECNPYDTFYGTGVKMTNKGLDRGHYQGANHMGKILASVRSKLVG